MKTIIQRLFLIFCLINSVYGQNYAINSKSTFKQLISDEYFNEKNNSADFIFDTIKSPEIQKLNFFTNKTYTSKNNVIVFKIVKINSRKNLIYFKADTIQGVINQYTLDSFWVGRIAYKNISKNPNRYLYTSDLHYYDKINFSKNFIVGFKDFSLMFYSFDASGNRNDIDSSTNNYLFYVQKLDSVFNFLELQINNDQNTPTITLFKNTHPLTSNYIDEYHKRNYGFGCYLIRDDRTPKNSLFELNVKELEHFYKILQPTDFPLLFRQVSKDKLEKGILNSSIMWLFDHKIYSFPYTK